MDEKMVKELREALRANDLGASPEDEWSMLLAYAGACRLDRRRVVELEVKMADALKKAKRGDVAWACGIMDTVLNGYSSTRQDYSDTSGTGGA